jgi:alkylation response protein AidB-like acyl-CoA dehydrogenase
VYRIIRPSRGELPTMTSSENETASEVWQPPPPALLSPWHTPEREALQLQARRFATEEVLPVANELDPQKGEIPASLLDRLAELGYFGITVPAEAGGLGLGVFEYCMVSEELARAWMSAASILARSQGLGTAVADAAPAGSGSARSRCRSPTPAPTSPASPPAPSARATSGW